LSDNPSPIPPQTPSQFTTCPNCRQSVAFGLRFCPHCGSQLTTMPPVGYGPPIMSAPEVQHREDKRLAIAIVLVALALFGVFGFLLYDMTQPGGTIFQSAAAASDKAGASSAVDNLQATCLSTSTDTSGLPYSATVYITYGLSNPSRYSMDSTWRLTIDYTGAGVVLTSSQTFHVPAQGTAYPRWQFTMTSGQISALGQATNQNFVVSIDTSFTVHGTYGIYDVNRHASYDSATNTSTGTGSSSSSTLPSC